MRRRRKRPQAGASANAQQRTRPRADAPAEAEVSEDNSAHSLHHRNNAPAVAEGRKSGAHRATGGEPYDRKILEECPRLRTIPRKLRSALSYEEQLDLPFYCVEEHNHLFKRIGEPF